jgi:hypothetical protein
MPSRNPDPRVHLPIPGEHIVDGQRFFEKKIKQKTLDALYKLGLYDIQRSPNNPSWHCVQRRLLSSGADCCGKHRHRRLSSSGRCRQGYFHSMLSSSVVCLNKRGGPYNMTDHMLQNCLLPACTRHPPYLQAAGAMKKAVTQTMADEQPGGYGGNSGRSMHKWIISAGRRRP